MTFEDEKENSKDYVIKDGNVHSDYTVRLSESFVFLKTSRRKIHNLFLTEQEAGKRMVRQLEVNNYALGIKSLQKLKETLELIEEHPEWRL